MVVADSHGVGVLSGTSNHFRLVAEMPKGLRHSRLNDAAVDPRGRVWFTSMNVAARPGEGAIFRLAEDRIESAVENLSVPGGLAWSSDGGTIYVAEASRRVVYRADFDLDEGSIGDLVPFAKIPETDGTPDGIALDSEGSLG